MRGRKPKERDCYVLRMGDGTLVEVSREVYLEWYQSRRRERYQDEKSRKHGVYSLDELEEKEISRGLPSCVRDGLEETALRNLCRDKVREALGKLPKIDAALIDLLYFKETTVTDAAKICNCSRKTIQNRRKRILEELGGILKEQGIQGGYF
ncbi:sigma-70 family RNA polymerase sigma factor [Clostridiaceae bacterium]|nr:sigma-70 family RNA polymerase sigma factor [Clostridiaceae bacterium]